MDYYKSCALTQTEDHVLDKAKRKHEYELDNSLEVTVRRKMNF